MGGTRFVSWESSCRVRRVLQDDATGCGVACLAMVANVHYPVARAVFDKLGMPARRPKRPYASNFKDLRKALGELGIANSMERWPGWEHFSGVGIIAVNASPGRYKGNWHWVVAEEHSQFGVVIHDPTPSLPILLRNIPEGFLSEPFSRCEPRRSWIRIHSFEPACDQ